MGTRVALGKATDGTLIKIIFRPDPGLLFLAVEMGAVTPKVEPFEPTKSKKIRSNSVDPDGSPEKKKKKRSRSEPRPESPKMEILEAKSPKKDMKKKKDKKKKTDKDPDKEKEVSSKESRSDKSENLVSPKSQK